MKIFNYLILVIATALICSACSPAPAQTTLKTQQAEAGAVVDQSIIEITVGGVPLSVEAVTSSETITKGLGERDTIGSDGMLFFLPEERFAYFWMKGMRFDLDLIWINTDSVVGITPNVPALKSGQQKLPTYSSPVAVTHVLEVPAGDAVARGIEVGDEVVIQP